MKSMLAACAVCALITVGAWYALTHVVAFTAADRNVSDGAVRLGDAGPAESDADPAE